jgi:N-acyl-D-amino-acid deacylase
MAGKYLSDIARGWNTDIRQAAERLLPAGQITFQMDEEDVRRIMAHPMSVIGSDGIPHDAHPHPRLWGTFPRVLGHYARELKLFSMETAIHKITGRSAELFGMLDRGVIREGAYADLVLFDPHTVIDRATFENPIQESIGIEQVWVNGVPTYAAGKGATGEKPGRLVTRNRV